MAVKIKNDETIKMNAEEFIKDDSQKLVRICMTTLNLQYEILANLF